jgi:membrane dipeptidase
MVLSAIEPVFDGHNDLAWKLRTFGPRTSLDISSVRPELHTDLPRLRRGGVGAQFWSVFVPGSISDLTAVRQVLEQINLVRRVVASNSSALQFARTADDVVAAREAGKIASLLGAEGGKCLGESLDVLRLLAQLGLRYMTLTHNESLSWADSATDVAVAGGLNAFGLQVVDEMNRLGVIVDLSHVAPTTMGDALDRSRVPVMFSHSSCFSVTDHPRNVPDHILSRLAVNGGICMVTFVPQFVSDAVWAWEREKDAVTAGMAPHEIEQWIRLHPSPRASITDVADHVEHAREAAGLDHIGVGGDFDGCESLPVGLESVAGYPALFEELAGRGWSADELSRIASLNMMRVLADVDGSGSSDR